MDDVSVLGRAQTLQIWPVHKAKSMGSGAGVFSPRTQLLLYKGHQGRPLKEPMEANAEGDEGKKKHLSSSTSSSSSSSSTVAAAGDLCLCFH